MTGDPARRPRGHRPTRRAPHPATAGSGPTSRGCGPWPSCWSSSTTPTCPGCTAASSASTSSSSSPASSSPGSSSGSGRPRGRTSLARSTAAGCRRILPAATLVIVVTVRRHLRGARRRLRQPDGRRRPVDGRVPGQRPLRRHRHRLPDRAASRRRRCRTSGRWPSRSSSTWSTRRSSCVAASLRSTVTLRARLVVVLVPVIAGRRSCCRSSRRPVARPRRSSRRSPGPGSWPSAPWWPWPPPRCSASRGRRRHLHLGGPRPPSASAAVAYSAATPYPGTAVALPVVGTALVIAGGTPVPAAGRRMRSCASAPFQWFGRLSYSLYLWHWPILIIAAEAAGREQPPVPPQPRLAAPSPWSPPTPPSDWSRTRSATPGCPRPAAAGSPLGLGARPGRHVPGGGHVALRHAPRPDRPVRGPGRHARLTDGTGRAPAHWRRPADHHAPRRPHPVAGRRPPRLGRTLRPVCWPTLRADLDPRRASSATRRGPTPWSSTATPTRRCGSPSWTASPPAHWRLLILAKGDCPTLDLPVPEPPGYGSARRGLHRL